MKHLLLIFLSFGSISARLDTKWWRHTSIYEIVIHAFKDSDGDGIGDIKGITSKLDHLVDLGIETIYITPFYKTTFLDMGYDITNYSEIDPMFGTVADFEELMKEMKLRGMKLMIDLVINHTGDKHPWFLNSIDRIDPYTDYYIWKNPSYYLNGEPQPPNQWKTWFGENVWIWNDKRKQFYYHVFMKQQVDLNLRNENVKKELKNMIKFWMDKGVTGFRLDAPMYYIEDEYMRQNGQRDQRENFAFMHELRVFLDSYNKKQGGCERIFAAEAHNPPELAALYYGTKNYPINHFPFNYYFEYNENVLSASELDHMIHKWLSYVPKGETAAWVSQDHDHSRTGSRIRPEYTDIYTILTSMLPGIVHYYYGNEIGLLDGYITKNQMKDILGDGTRDPNRLLMQWDQSINAGFSHNLTTFLPSASDYVQRNVLIERKKEISHYNLMKSLIKLRRTKTLKEGKFMSKVYSSHVHIFWRSLMGHETYVVMINLKDAESVIDLKKTFKYFPQIISVEAASINAGYEKGQAIVYAENNNFILKPLSAVVLSVDQYFQQAR